MKQYVRFELLDTKPKTNVYSVISKSSDYVIGVVKWYAPWRQYTFFPFKDTIYSRGCMADINIFIDEQMEKRK